MAAISLGGRSIDEDKELLREWVKKVHKSLHDPRDEGKCFQLSKDGTKWRHGWMPKGLLYMDLDQIQALFRFFDLPELEPVKYGGSCAKCVHGQNVSSATGMWPVIDDCSGCRSPAHPYYLDARTMLKKMNTIKKDQVFKIPTGGTIPIYVERLKKNLEDGGPWEYYERGGFVHRLSDDRRICKVENLGLLHIPGSERYKHRG